MVGVRLLASLLAVGLVSAQSNYVERECPCTLKSLWVDVAVAIDLSAGMTPAGVTQVVADIASVFAQSNISQSLGQFSRVGIVTYTDTYTTVFNMSYFTSTDQLMNEIWGLIPTTTPNKVSNTKSGLEGAYNLLGRANGERSNVQRALILYASDYNKDGENDPVSLSNVIKSSGITIITVSFNQGGEEKVLEGLLTLASPNMAFNNTDGDVTGEIQGALCQVNCYCPNSWRQFGTTYHNPLKKYGECLKFGDIAAVWTPAKYSCQSLMPGGFLATEFSQSKHDYLLAMAKADPTFPAPHDYHIGLSMDSTGNWMWEQGLNKKKVTLNRSYFSSWLSSYPTTPIGSNQCVLNTPSDTSENKVGWKNVACTSVSKRYACQVSTCDTDTYCA